MALKSQSTACPSLRACRLHGQGLLCQSGKRLHKNLMKNYQWDQLLKTISASVLGNILPPPPTCCEQTLAENLADGNLLCFAAAKDKNPLVRLISRILCNSNNKKKQTEASAVINTFLVKMPSISGFPLGPGGCYVRLCCASCSSFSFVCFHSLILFSHEGKWLTGSSAQLLATCGAATPPPPAAARMAEGALPWAEGSAWLKKHTEPSVSP